MKKRLFLAIEIPPAVKAEFYGLEEEFSAKRARWMKEKNWHITVLFLGETEEEKIEEISEIIKKTTKETKVFKLRIKEARFEPFQRKPRMIWAVFEESEEFKKVAENLEKNLSSFLEIKNNFRKEKIPHITLARFDDFSGDGMKKINLKGEFEAGEIVLMESELRREGAEYRELERFKMSDF